MSANEVSNSDVQPYAPGSTEALAIANEPDPDSFATVVTGLHIWAARRGPSQGPNAPSAPAPPPLVPWEDLPFPRSDRARIAACTVRWQFKGRFSANKEENVARGSFMVQVQRYLETKGIKDPYFTVNFPKGVGRGRFVDVCGQFDHLSAIAEVPLVFRGTPLQRHLVGPALPRTAMVVEISNFSENEEPRHLATTIAIFLMRYCRVHDIWAEMHSLPGRENRVPANKLVVLVDTAGSNPNEGRNPAKVQAIPGYINLSGQHCELQYVGRLNWCTTCRANITQYHCFDNCPRRRCFKCDEPGHSASICPLNTDHHQTLDEVADRRQPATGQGENVELNYGQP